QLTGQGVFGDLSRPAVIGSELLQGESSFETIKWEEGKSLVSGDWHPLFIRRGKQLRAVPHDAVLKEMAKGEDEVICLRRSEGFLLRALYSGGFINTECENIESLYQLLATIAAEHLPSSTEEQILEDLEEQGRVFPAFLGHGIAIPNLYCENLDYRICFIAHLKKGLTIPVQNEAIDFIFFIISPEGDTEGHLATLAEIAKNCRRERLRKQIKSAESVDEVVAAISG
ncbi:MAG: PTS sugar transporter subunit IIA, partial [Verrucomicrobiota bacterium]|nr:PTS sugar transporter subunit IIA [Verrucomicrobiota bacterium]